MVKTLRHAAIPTSKKGSNMTSSPSPTSPTPSPSSQRLLRLGSALLLGVAAGYGVRYVSTRRERARYAAPRNAPTPTELIDWPVARRVALRVSGWEGAGVPAREMRAAQYADLVARSEPLIAEYLGAELPQPLERVRVVDRREWLEANFVSLQSLFDSLLANLPVGSRLAEVSPLGRRVAGLETGALLGFLARRVLGQYDLSLLSPDPHARGALLFVEPNIAKLEGELGLTGEDFRLWIALHETTHAFQFESFGWVRPHFGELLHRLVGGLAARLVTPQTNLLELLSRLTRPSGGLLERFLTLEERATFNELQALMSLVEGYAEHVMNAVGTRILPSFGAIEARVRERRENASLLLELFDRLTGMELKKAQYRQGEAFVKAVVGERGLDFMNRVWEGPENLPTLAEIREPSRWIARMARG